MQYIYIKKVKISKTAALAPMADAGDAAFRIMAKRFSAAYTVGEMVSAKGLLFKDKKTRDLLKINEREHCGKLYATDVLYGQGGECSPNAIQLFGSEPDVMARAVEIALENRPDVIDINAGCPVNKIVSSGSGSALMKNPKIFGEVVGAAVRTAEVKGIPVTVKIRSGWDGNSINAVEIAKIAESVGVSAITIHGRTREQMYSGNVDLKIIAAVKNSVSIPVIGNGDVNSVETFLKMQRQTNCDLIMIGRAALGRPWIFSEITRCVSKERGVGLVPLTLGEQLDVMKEHIELAVLIKKENAANEDDNLERLEKNAMRESRKHAAWYIKGIRNAAMFRNRCMTLEKLEDLYELIERIKQTNFEGF